MPKRPTASVIRAVGRWWPALFPVLALAYSVWAASRVTAFISRRRRV
ncbi:hypothetical protein RVF83_05005 [Gordonia rubripertincta]|uniref:Uncharacterized protein n=1 Tax=Gordonia rubripertincta TaxID=36822 RepID=A0AAW6RC92_GORRU|nr:hypothetical protein [Gordonia rubripertincta]MDG6783594.1 hypothetical protein [Gordonia rubripertincta]